MPQGGWAHWSHSAQVPGGMGRKRDRADSEAETEEGKRRREDGLSPGEAVHTDGGDRSPKKRETKQQQELSEIVSDAHWPQSEAIDEHVVAEIRAHEAQNSTVLEPRVPTRLHRCCTPTPKGPPWAG